MIERLTKLITRGGLSALMIAAACHTVLANSVSAKVEHDRGIALLRKAIEKSRSIHSFTAQISQVMEGDDMVGPVAGNVEWREPTYYHIEVWPKATSGPQHEDKRQPHTIFHGDGKLNYYVDPDGSLTKSYTSQASAVDLFFIVELLTSHRRDQLLNEASKSIVHVSNQNWNGDRYNVIELADRPTAKTTDRFVGHFYIGKDGLIHRFVMEHNGRPGVDSYLTNLRTNVPLSKGQFTFAMPANASQWKELHADNRTQIDARSKELLRGVMERVQGLNAITATSTVDETDTWPSRPILHSVTTTKAKYLRPGYISLESTTTELRGTDAPVETVSTTIAGAGMYWDARTDTSGTSYVALAADNHNRTSFLAGHHVPLLRDFFDIDKAPFYLRFGLDEIHYAGTETWNGATYDVLQGTRAPYPSSSPGSDGPSGEDMRIYIGEDRLIHRILEHLLPNDGGTVTREISLTDIDSSPKLDLTQFYYTPPPGAKNITDKGAPSPPQE